MPHYKVAVQQGVTYRNSANIQDKTDRVAKFNEQIFVQEVVQAGGFEYGKVSDTCYLPLVVCQGTQRFRLCVAVNDVSSGSWSTLGRKKKGPAQPQPTQQIKAPPKKQKKRWGQLNKKSVANIGALAKGEEDDGDVWANLPKSTGRGGGGTSGMSARQRLAAKSLATRDAYDNPRTAGRPRFGNSRTGTGAKVGKAKKAAASVKTTTYVVKTEKDVAYRSKMDMGARCDEGVSPKDEVEIVSAVKEGNITWVKTADGRFLPAVVIADGETHTLLEPKDGAAEITEKVAEVAVSGGADQSGAASWDVTEVWTFLNGRVNDFVANLFREEKIDGKALLELTSEAQITERFDKLAGKYKGPLREKVLAAVDEARKT